MSGFNPCHRGISSIGAPGLIEGSGESRLDPRPPWRNGPVFGHIDRRGASPQHKNLSTLSTGPSERSAPWPWFRGSLAPDRAVNKASASDSSFSNTAAPYRTLLKMPRARLAELELVVNSYHVLVLRNAGPVASGMREAGSRSPCHDVWPPGHLGHSKSVRRPDEAGPPIGTVVLHRSPDSAVGRPLCLVLDVATRRLDLLSTTPSSRADDPTSDPHTTLSRLAPSPSPDGAPSQPRRRHSLSGRAAT
jgi:dihydroxyacid dehydratase/phosphogluconate dehydratase